MCTNNSGEKTQILENHWFNVDNKEESEDVASGLLTCIFFLLI